MRLVRWRQLVGAIIAPQCRVNMLASPNCLQFCPLQHWTAVSQIINVATLAALSTQHWQHETKRMADMTGNACAPFTVRNSVIAVIGTGTQCHNNASQQGAASHQRVCRLHTHVLAPCMQHNPHNKGHTSTHRHYHTFKRAVTARSSAAALEGACSTAARLSTHVFN